MISVHLRLLAVRSTIFFLMLCVASNAAFAEPTVIGQWKLSPQKTNGQSVVSADGSTVGTILGQVKFETEKPHALQFDGKSNRVSMKYDADGSNLPKRAFSVEAWVAVDKPMEWGGIIGAIQDNGSYERGWLLGFRKSKFCFAVSTTGPKRLTYLTAPQDFSLGSWYHVAATYDGKTMRLFVDGQLAASSTAQKGDILYPPKTFYEIGAYHDDNELYPLTGRIAEVALFDGAIDKDEISKRFAAHKTKFPNIEPTTQAVVGWPTYQHDDARSGYTFEELKLPLEEAWVYRARHAPEPAWPPPANQDFWHNKYGLKARVTYDHAFQVVSDGDSVYFGSSADDKIYCLDLQTGQERWSFFTEGPVRLAPTVHNGNVYFGSDDGCVYCVDKVDGSLAWKYRASEKDRRIPGNGRIISSWPVRTGVLIHDGHCRFGAGLFPTQGTWQFAVDAETGKQLAKGEVGFSPQGYMERQGSNIIVSQGRSPKTLLARLTRGGKSRINNVGAVKDEYPFAKIGAANVRFAGGDGKVAAFSGDATEPIWTAEVDGKAHSLAVAGGCLLVSTDSGVVHCFRHAAETTKTQSQATETKVSSQLSPRFSPLADFILKSTESEQGYCLVWGSGQGRLALAIARRSALKVVGIEPNERLVQQSRAAIDNAGLYGRVSIHHGSLERLPYADGIFNLIVSETMLDADDWPDASAEVVRVLRPGGGVAFLGSDDDTHEKFTNWSDGIAGVTKQIVEQNGRWLTLNRASLPNAGEWSHIYGDPSNTACSNDGRVKTNFALQWFGGPGPQQMIDRHHRTVPPLYKAGRMFIPGDNRMIAVDAYNGTVLWNTEVADSRRVGAMRDSGSMAATEDYLYVVARDRCYGLASTSGEARLNFAVPASDDNADRHWGYVARVEKTLFGSTTKPEASRSGHSKKQIYETYFDFVPVVTSDSVFAMDRHGGEKIWQYNPKNGAIANSTIGIGNGRMYFIESKNAATLTEKSGRSKLTDLFKDGVNLVALDANTGNEIWRQEYDLSALQHCVFLSYSQEKLIVVGTKNKTEGERATVWYDLHAFNAANGKPLWTATQNQGQRPGGDHGEQDHHPVIVGDRVIAEPYAYNLRTGKPIENWSFRRGGHGCGSLSASASSLFFRATNPTLCNLATGQNHKLTKVSRPGCWINMIPAGGMLLIPEASSGCTCNFAIQSSMSFMALPD